MRAIDLKRWKFRYGGLEIVTHAKGLSIELHSVYAEPKNDYGRTHEPHPDAYIDYMKGKGGDELHFYLHDDSHIAYLGNSRWDVAGNVWVFQFLLLEDDYESKMNELV